MLVVIDYGVGNLGSLLNMCKHIGIPAIIGRTSADILNATHIILPGVGSFGFGIKKLRESGLVSVLEDKVLDQNTPILGICLGMQLMTMGSEEGNEKGLGWIDADVRRFPQSRELKVPHMGWSSISHKKKSYLIQNQMPNERYYFVHSYFVSCNNSSDCVAQVNYGINFDVVFQKNNIYGTQFHPEKSHRFGMNVIKNFSEL